MSRLGDIIREFISEPATAATGQKSKSIIAGSSMPGLFNARKRDIQKWKNIIRQGGPVTEAIECYPRMSLSNGYRLESIKGADDPYIEELKGDLDDMDIEAKIFRLIFDALWSGDGYMEKVKGAGMRRVAGLVPIPPDSMEILVDKKGAITGYQQKAGMFGAIEAKFAVDDIIHLQFGNIGDDQYGLSLVGRAYDDIMRDTATAESIAEAIKRHGFPKWHITAGLEGEDIPPSTLKTIGRNFQELDVNNEFVTMKDVTINPLDTGGVQNIAEYSNVMIQREAAALGVPEEMLGLGRGSTEATANVRLQSFYDKIGWLQKPVARAITRQLLDTMTPKPRMIKWVFNDPNPTDDLQNAQVVQALMSNPLDPEMIITVDEARAKMNMGPRQDDFVEDDYIKSTHQPLTQETINQPPGEVKPTMQEISLAYERAVSAGDREMVEALRVELTRLLAKPAPQKLTDEEWKNMIKAGVEGIAEEASKTKDVKSEVKE